MSWRRNTDEWALDWLRAVIGGCWLLVALMVSFFAVWFTYRGLHIVRDYIARHWF